MISEIYLIVDDAAARGGELIDALRPLESSPERPRCLWARVYIRSETGAALIHLCYASLTPRQLSWLGGACDAAEVLLLAPAMLTTSDQEQFFREVLGQFERRLGPYRSTSAAVGALVHELAQGNPQNPARRSAGMDRSIDSTPTAATEPVAPPTRRLGSEGDAAATAQSPPPIEVRYRRGDDWGSGRLRKLNPKGAFITTSTPPPLRDLVRLALRFGERGVRLQGVVSRQRKPGDGSDVGFMTTFFGVTAQQQEQLVALLRDAQAAGVALTPPPERAAMRFPVRWPMRFTSSNGLLTLPALDLSRSGIFVGGGDRKLGPELSFLMPHDTDEGPIAGHAAVARVVDAEMAESRGLHRGVGTYITRLDGSDRRRYAELIGRVRRRTTKHVVVCAAGARARALAASLSSVGYAVSTSDDPDALEAKWQGRESLPDLALFDATVRRGLGSVHLSRMWRRRRVICLPSADEMPKAIRVTVDAALQIRRTE